MANKNWTKEKQKEYYERRGKELAKINYLKNKQKRQEYQKQYFQENKSEQYLKNRERLLKNREKYNKTTNEWRKKNKGRLKERQRKYMREYRKKSLSYRLRENVGHYIRKHLLNNNDVKQKTYKNYLGCTIKEYRIYLEKLFTPEMNWDNYGSYWEIDHIKPCSSFDLTIKEEQLKCFHHTNTQPMYWKNNREKSNKY